MDQRLIDLYHDYAHVHFDRRVFLEKAARIVGSVSAAAALLPLLAPDDAKAAMVAARRSAGHDIARDVQGRHRRREGLSREAAQPPAGMARWK